MLYEVITNDSNNGITDEAIEYFLPLMQGEISPLMKNGIPVHINLMHHKKIK